jgi:hypothetical protein
VAFLGKLDVTYYRSEWGEVGDLGDERVLGEGVYAVVMPVCIRCSPYVKRYGTYSTVSIAAVRDAQGLGERANSGVTSS